MPIPKPKEGETESDFIGRCMHAIGNEYDQDQALGICYSTWRESKKEVDTANGGELVEDELGEEKSVKIPEVLYRDFTFDPASLDPKEPLISLSLSSEAPYERFFGHEILDHAPASIRMDRMMKGAPLLFNHDPDRHIGRIIEAKSDGKKLQVTAKFGNSALAREKLQDVKDGILKEASVGYAIHKMQLEESDDEKGDTYRVTDWEPYEGSLVTIPADCDVGIGRAVREKEILVRSKKPFANSKVVNQNREKGISMAEGTPPVVTPAAPAPVIDLVVERKTWETERSENAKKINDFVATLKEKRKIDCSAIAMKHLANGCDFDNFRQEVLETEFRAEPIQTPTSDSHLGMNRKERRQFSVVKLIREIGESGIGGKGLTGIEKEATECIAQNRDSRDNRDHAGVTIPDDIAFSNLAEDFDLSKRGMESLLFEISRMKRAMATTPGSAGGYLVATDLLTGSIIELLRNKALVMGLGPTHLGGLVGNIAIPKVVSGASVFWLPEAGSVSETDPGFAQLGLTPHRMGADTAFTKQLVNQASLSVEAFVRDDIARGMAVERDRVCINGSGVGGEPLGILNTPTVGTLSFGGPATWAKIVQFESDIESANAILGPMAFLTTPAAKGKWKTIPKVSNFPVYLWDNDPAGTVINGVRAGLVNGYPAYATKNVPGDRVVFGVWSELIVADWAGIDVVVDPYSLKRTEQIEVTIHQWMDTAIRHPVAFDTSTDSGAQ